ncbi:MAG: WS/DGAT domain-containing protein, partial [Halioglobus sp.]|nr:WS/DGAT domain-containing protein [Halioglobus sp.]
GPDFPLYCAGARMVDYYGLGVLTPGVGIFHLVFSYAGKLTLSVLADRDIMPDPEFYHDCLVGSYEEMYAAAMQLGPRTASKSNVAAKAKIDSPKRKRAVGSSKPKLSGKSKAKAGAGAKTKAGASAKAKAKAKAKAGARGKSQAKTRAAAAARPKPKAKRKAATKTKAKAKAGAARPRVKRRSGAAQPKLKSA